MLEHSKGSPQTGLFPACTDQGCPTQVFTHTFSSPSNKHPLFSTPYSGARLKSTSSLFCSLNAWRRTQPNTLAAISALKIFPSSPDWALLL